MRQSALFWVASQKNDKMTPNRKKWFWLISCLLLVMPAWAQMDWQTWTSDPLLQSASVSIQVQDIASGQSVMQLDPQRQLIPASVLKLLPAALMLQRYGSAHTFTTTLVGSPKAHITNDTLFGFLLLIGAGDPSLGSPRFAGAEEPDQIRSEWSNALLALGITHVTGGVVGIAAPFRDILSPGGYAVEDAGNYYAAPASGLSFADNTYHLTVSSELPGEPLQILSLSPPVPGLQHTSLAVAAGTGDQAYIHGMPGHYHRSIVGTLQPYHRRYVLKGAVPDPVLFAAQQCQQAIEMSGITFGKAASTSIGTYEGLPAIWQHTSPELQTLLAHTLEKSDNLFAETWVRHLFQDAGAGREWQALEDTFRALLPHRFRGNIADGSGLSRSNTVSAEDLTAFLIHQFQQPYRDVWLDVLAEGGKEGTLRLLALPEGFPGRIFGKSGYMTGVRSYAGYYQSASGRWYAFALLANHFDGSGAAMRQAFSKVILQFASLP